MSKMDCREIESLLRCDVFRFKVRLKSLLLREEFFPFIEEIKHSIAVMTTAANGTFLHPSFYEILNCPFMYYLVWIYISYIFNYIAI